VIGSWGGSSKYGPVRSLAVANGNDDIELTQRSHAMQQNGDVDT
jgi:hypothetical protein